MTGRYKAYPEYKSSEVEWLEEVPYEWDVKPCRAIVMDIVEKNVGALDQNYLSLMANVGVIRYEDKGDIGNKKPDDLSKCKIVKKGNLVINSMNYAIGSYGMSEYDGVCSPVYIVLDVDENVLERRFALRIFENRPFQKYLATFGNGILEHRAAIGWDDIKGAYIPVPTKDDQLYILSFLDHETAKIDTLIKKQQQLIKLLKEKRHTVISHAVTKGLNLDALMKDSGVEWLGDVPEHWGVLAMKRVLENIEQGTSPIASNIHPRVGEVGVLKVSAVKQGIFQEHESKMLEKNLFEARYQIHKNDLLVTRGNTPELVADACVVKEEPEIQLMMCDLIYRLSTKSVINKKFLCYWLLSSKGRFQIKKDARGSSMTMAKVSQGHIKSWLITFPPMNEQNLIVTYLMEVENKLNTLISKSQLMIFKLKERRIALISAAVTGKIDVRNWQPSEQNQTSKEDTL
jgi:type I restriction enzyme, S subunit